MKNLLLSLLIALSFISVNAQKYAANLDMTVIKNYKKFEESCVICSIKKGSTYHVDSIYQITTPIPNENNANLSFYMNTPDVMLASNGLLPMNPIPSMAKRLSELGGEGQLQGG